MQDRQVIGIALIAGLLIGGTVGYTTAKKLLKPERIVVNHVEFVEKKVYVKTKTQNQTTTTKPDGTTIVSTTVTTGEANATTNSVTSTISEKPRAAIKLGGQVLRRSDARSGVSLGVGARVYEDTWVTGQVGYLDRPFVGIGLEIQR